MVGNPKPASRTRTLAEAAAAEIAARRRGADPAVVVDVDVIELAELGAALLGWNDPAVVEALERVYAADVVVVASPTYKATYTGLLKLFCDQVPAGRLAGVVAVPVMTAGSADHRLAADVHLRPLLAELGAVQAVPVLFATEADLDDVAGIVAAWSDSVAWSHVFVR